MPKPDRSSWSLACRTSDPERCERLVLRCANPTHPRNAPPDWASLRADMRTVGVKTKTKRAARPPGTPSKPQPPARVAAPIVHHGLHPPSQPPRKEDAACCKAVALSDGRPVLGWCGPDCQRRVMYLAHAAWMSRTGSVVARETVSNERRAYG